MTLRNRLTTTIEDALDALDEHLEKTNDELSHGPLGRAWALTSITLGLLMVAIGVGITILDPGAMHGPAIIGFAGLMAILGGWMFLTN